MERMEPTTAVVTTASRPARRRPGVAAGLRRGVRALGAPGAAANAGAALADAERTMAYVNERLATMAGPTRP